MFCIPSVTFILFIISFISLFCSKLWRITRPGLDIRKKNLIFGHYSGLNTRSNSGVIFHSSMVNIPPRSEDHKWATTSPQWWKRHIVFTTQDKVDKLSRLICVFFIHKGSCSLRFREREDTDLFTIQ